MAGIRTRKRNHEPRKRPTQARSRETVAVIVEAAAQVFEDRGYHETTTDLVAERAGVSIGTLYQYFPDKDVLLVALFEAHLGEVEALYTGLGEQLVAGAPLRDIVGRCVHEMFELHRSRPRLHRIFVEDAPLPRRLFEDYAMLERSVRARWVAYLGAEVRDPDLVAMMLLNVLEAMAHRYTLYAPPGRDPVELEATTVDLIVAYVDAQRRIALD